MGDLDENMDTSLVGRHHVAMLKLRYLVIPLAAVATIAALSTQTASHATTRAPAAATVSEQVVTCTDENRNTVDICIVADSLSH